MNIAEANTPVAQNIPVIIKKNGMKNLFVAEKIGMTAQQFTEIITGRRLIKVCEVPKIAQVLGVTPNELYGIGGQ